MAMFSRAERLIDRARGDSYPDAGAALADIYMVSAELNRELKETVDERRDLETAFSNDIGDRLREVLARFTEMVESVCRQFGGDSYSVTAGFPMGVTATITWERD